MNHPKSTIALSQSSISPAYSHYMLSIHVQLVLALSMAGVPRRKVCIEMLVLIYICLGDYQGVPQA